MAKHQVAGKVGTVHDLPSGSARPRPLRAVVRLGAGILVLTAIALAYRGLEGTLDDPMVSAILLALAVLAIVPIIGRRSTNRY